MPLRKWENQRTEKAFNSSEVTQEVERMELGFKPTSHVPLSHILSRSVSSAREQPLLTALWSMLTGLATASSGTPLALCVSSAQSHWSTSSTSGRMVHPGAAATTVRAYDPDAQAVMR